MGLLGNLFGGGQPNKVVSTWENLPSCLMLMLEDFDSQKIIGVARSTDKDVVCLVPADAHIDPTGLGQIELLYQFADEPSLAVLTWRVWYSSRRTFLASTSLASHTFVDFIRYLSVEAKHLALRCDSA